MEEGYEKKSDYKKQHTSQRMKEGHIPRSLLVLKPQQLLDLVHLSRKMRRVYG